MIFTNRKKRGFTLIELLVVISIISLLSSVVFATTNSARKKAQIAVFFQGMRQVQIALELYKADYGHYPYTWTGNCNVGDPFPGVWGGLGGYDSLTPVLKKVGVEFIPKYISQFPNVQSFSNMQVFYADEVGAACIYSGIPAGDVVCNGKPVKGYMIDMYDGDQEFEGQIPISHSFYYSSGIDPTSYCLTAD